ncbi:MAG TPA: MYG1 family protein [Candidatus Paceibacterota bacterium]|nr:MYG1 family protein [Candidatus Paceibacterota bacterium]
MPEKKIRIVTHSGTFHADELLAVASLELYFDGKPYEVVRTRDPEVIKTGDYVVDVGMVYDPAINRYDHHQKGGAGERDGVPYSSFGLVWKHFGEAIAGSPEVAQAIERKIVWPIDMGDNGVEVYQTVRPGLHPYLLHNVVMAYRPTWKEGEGQDVPFMELVAFMRRLLEREIRQETDKLAGYLLVEAAYHAAPDKRLIELDGQYPWHEALAKFPEPLYVVKPKHQNTGWEVECVRTDVHSFGNRKSLPEAWAGLVDGQLAEATGVLDALFCHNKRYVAVARSRDGALALAQKALNT